MEKKNNLENIKDVVNHAYGINPISVSRFNLIFSKFTTTDHHFLVKTKKEIFFVKRYEISNLEKIKNEIRNINKVSNKINIPRIVKTKTKKNYFTASKNIFVLYQYINGKNLKEMRVSLPYFFNVICDIEKKFLKVKTSKQIFYRFHSRIERFETKAKKLLKILERNSSPLVIENKKYLKFLIKEVEEMKSKILALNIKQHFIHGDLLMQNIILDQKEVFWVVDWEKSHEYITSIDILKSVLFTIFDPSKKNLNLNIKQMVKWSEYCFKRLPLENEELANVFDVYYFHFITGIDFLEKVYIKKQSLNKKMLHEDFLISKWLKRNKAKLQTNLNKILLIL
ncbi:MAG: hypothetical protein UW07_C0052G0004 [Candidatus Nomurabacteria bacterium GW2011_GWF2_43_8]|uniref:Aminoglycoside phosphotransferase domain-containing protein n=1 Tax=Candidatus Nomurabacteria bacterium GW2011_GWF2_43_8 TaxID=1618779 RepID=A0A0G1FHN4_9BACT|nr:MAG: hypothetical protein UW07_C0052G0004 [Candidatus Nomurabacteria bacterium GW2011_GWF2_43_8]